MQRPGTGIVQIYRHDEIRRSVGPGIGKHMSVLSRRILRVDDATIPRSVSLCKDEEVVAMQVHGMIGEGGVDYDQDYCGVVVIRVDVQFGRRRRKELGGCRGIREVRENRIVEIPFERGGVHVK